MKCREIALFGSILFLLAGCDSSPTFYNHVQQTQNYSPEIKQVIEKNIDQKFGQPAQIIVDEIFPFKLGGIETKVVSIAEDRKSITVELKDGWKTLIAGQQVLFPGVTIEAEEGKPAPGPFRIASVDESSKKINLKEALPAAIAADAVCLLDAGRTVKQGQRLYMQHCVHCHGVSGDGNGASASVMNPKPRDFRLGKFKYTSTGAVERAHDKDLERILKEGIAGTYMPSFKLLEKSELEGLISYIKFLGTRGELEGKLCVELDLDFSNKSVKERVDGGEKIEEIMKEFEEYEKSDLPGIINDQLTGIKQDWDRAQLPQVEVIPSVDRPEPDSPSLANPQLSSVENGYQIYMSKKAQCTACHGESGRGDGYQTRDMQKDLAGKEYPRPGLHDDWGNHTPPRDLTLGIMRGGRRPVDIFRRIYAGIKGTRMLAFGGTGLKDEEIWDVVNYLLVLPELNGQPPSAKGVKPQGSETPKVSQTP